MPNAETLRAYEVGWQTFADYCAQYGIEPLEPRPGDLLCFIDGLRETCRKRGAARKLRAAINHRFASAGKQSPFDDPAVSSCWNGFHLSLSPVQNKKRIISFDELETMIIYAPDNLIGIRDRALLWVGWLSGLGCQMSSLRANEVIKVERGILIKGKTLLPSGSAAWRALTEWMGEARISCGDGSEPVFRAITKGGEIQRAPLGGQSIRNIVKRYIERIGRDPREYAGCSLRASRADALRLRRGLVLSEVAA